MAGFCGGVEGGGRGLRNQNTEGGWGGGALTPRGQELVRNVSSDVTATFCGDWRHLEAISRKSPKVSFFLKKTP